MLADDFFFDDGLAAPVEEGKVATQVGAGIDEPEKEEEAADGAEDDADDSAGWRASIEALVYSWDGEDLGLAFGEEDGGGRDVLWLSSSEVCEGLEGAGYY